MLKILLRKDTDMTTISELEGEILEFAKKRAIELKLVEKEGDVSVVLRIANYSKQHDGWSTNISEKDWDKIFTLDWDENQRALLEALRERKNKPMNGKEVEFFGVPINWNGNISPFTDLNGLFRSRCLPFHFAHMGKLPMSRRYEEGLFCLFNKFPEQL